MTPASGLVSFAKAMFRDMWDQLHGVQTASLDALKAELSRLERTSERLFDRILEAEAALIDGYEKRLAIMEKEKVALREKIAGSAQPPASFERVYRTAFNFLENPRNYGVQAGLCTAARCCAWPSRPFFGTTEIMAIERQKPPTVQGVSVSQ